MLNMEAVGPRLECGWIGMGEGEGSAIGINTVRKMVGVMVGVMVETTGYTRPI